MIERMLVGFATRVLEKLAPKRLAQIPKGRNPCFYVVIKETKSGGYCVLFYQANKDYIGFWHGFKTVDDAVISLRQLNSEGVTTRLEIQYPNGNYKGSVTLPEPASYL